MNKEVIIKDDKFTFVNSHYRSGQGFAHKSKLYKNDALLTTKTAQYMNRTWEEYSYQSVMKSCVDKAIKKELADHDILTELRNNL